MNKKMVPIALRNLNRDFSPWCWITSFELSAMTDRSLVSLRNWRLRGTGPEWSRDQKGKVWYRLADVLSWASDGQKTPDEIIDDFLHRSPEFAELTEGLGKEHMMASHRKWLGRPDPDLVPPSQKFALKSCSPIRMENP
ncbi:MAG: hypothetical protein ACK4FJ_03570 [Ferrovibrio sp.]|uniref:hypothetical protein n=1 Tax=Ferrovibrio sp. TaxID=1917215 RepID=UPI003919805C